MMKTIVIQAGNTDNKLTQQQWATYVADLRHPITYFLKLHFFGGSSTWEPWQNVCWVGEIDEKYIPELLKQLKQMRQNYRQDSVAVTIGETTLV